MAIVPNSSKFNKLTHNIASVVQVTNIQTTSAQLVDQNIIEYSAGYNFLEIYWEIVAPLVDVTAVLRLYKEFDNGDFQAISSGRYAFCKGKTLPTTAITVSASATVQQFVETVYVGSGRVALALEVCPDDTAIKIGIKRVPGDILYS